MKLSLCLVKNCPEGLLELTFTYISEYSLLNVCGMLGIVWLPQQNLDFILKYQGIICRQYRVGKLISVNMTGS